MRRSCSCSPALALYCINSLTARSTAACHRAVVRRPPLSMASNLSFVSWRRARSRDGLSGLGLRVIFDIPDDIQRLLAELLVIDLLGVDKGAAHHGQRAHQAGFGYFLVARAEQARGFGMEQGAIPAARRARHGQADQFLVLVRNPGICQPEIPGHTPKSARATFRHLLDPLRDSTEGLLDFPVGIFNGHLPPPYP